MTAHTRMFGKLTVQTPKQDSGFAQKVFTSHNRLELLNLGLNPS